LTLIVSAIALLASLTTLGDARLAQVAPVWATGVPRRRLVELELLRLLMLTAATAVIALPLGFALAWRLARFSHTTICIGEVSSGYRGSRTHIRARPLRLLRW
jgi:predicted lysophospholipase L1 biosynthesis ABC-type transport system permease subunit